MEVLITPGGRFAIGWIEGVAIMVTPPDWTLDEWRELGEITVQAQSSVHVHPVSLVYAPGRGPDAREQQVFLQMAPTLRMQRMKRLAYVTDSTEVRATVERLLRTLPIRVDWQTFPGDDAAGALAWLREISPFPLDRGLALFRHLLDVTGG